MKRIAIAVALAATMMSGAAFAKDDKPDYLNDKETYSCDKDDLTDRMKALYNDDGPSLFRMQVLYVKDTAELSRSADAVKCKATIVHARGKVSGVVSFTYEDGHALIGFKPGKGR